jgi:hypothetical protein
LFVELAVGVEQGGDVVEVGEGRWAGGRHAVGGLGVAEGLADFVPPRSNHHASSGATGAVSRVG